MPSDPCSSRGTDAAALRRRLPGAFLGGILDPFSHLPEVLADCLHELQAPLLVREHAAVAHVHAVARGPGIDIEQDGVAAP
jgi:hypothetical protein